MITRTNEQSQKTNLIGLPLATAHALLATQGINSEKITVIETAPPRAEKATGDWRVLHYRVSNQDAYEFIVAREQTVD
jgi:hypothetical protein